MGIPPTAIDIMVSQIPPSLIVLFLLAQNVNEFDV